MFKDARVESGKHVGLVSIDHSFDLFLRKRECFHYLLRKRECFHYLETFIIKGPKVRLIFILDLNKPENKSQGNVVMK